MSVIYLVRHGQASFGTDDYDRLSPHGENQSRLLGAQLAAQGATPNHLIHGTMLRQEQTLDGILDGLRTDAARVVDPRWNEFDAQEIVGAFPEQDPRASTDSRIFQKMLEKASTRWADGKNDDDYAETFAAFTGRIDAALQDTLGGLGRGESAIVVSSSGVIAWVAARLLDAGFPQWLALNRVTVNAGVTKIVSGSRGASLISFNDHSHLPSAEVTYR